jgi:hypothetical protein
VRDSALQQRDAIDAPSRERGAIAIVSSDPFSISIAFVTMRVHRTSRSRSRRDAVKLSGLDSLESASQDAVDGAV